MGFESILSAAGNGAENIASFLPGILDILLLVFLLIFIISGYKKGFIKKIVKLVGIIVAFAVAYSFAGVVVELLNTHFQLSELLAGALEGGLMQNEAFAQPADIEGLEQALLGLNLPEMLTDALIQALEGLNITQGQTLANVVAIALAPILLSIIVGVALFIVALILITVLANLLSSFLDKVPLLGTLNHVLGMLVGALEAIIYVYIILAVLSFLPMADLQTILSQTTILNWLRENNIIMLLYEQILQSEDIMQTIQDMINGAINPAPAIA